MGEYEEEEEEEHGVRRTDNRERHEVEEEQEEEEEDDDDSDDMEDEEAMQGGMDVDGREMTGSGQGDFQVDQYSANHDQASLYQSQMAHAQAGQYFMADQSAFYHPAQYEQLQQQYLLQQQQQQQQADMLSSFMPPQ